MQSQNCRFLMNGTGIVVTTTAISAGTELTIYLGPSYDWSNLCYTLYRNAALHLGLLPLPALDIQPSSIHYDILNVISRPNYSSQHPLLAGTAIRYFRCHPLPVRVSSSATQTLPLCQWTRAPQAFFTAVHADVRNEIAIIPSSSLSP
jgi:hypothetical protein